MRRFWHGKVSISPIEVFSPHPKPKIETNAKMETDVEYDA